MREECIEIDNEGNYKTDGWLLLDKHDVGAIFDDLDEQLKKFNLEVVWGGFPIGKEGIIFVFKIEKENKK